jgi:hypothetical protein
MATSAYSVHPKNEGKPPKSGFQRRLDRLVRDRHELLDVIERYEQVIAKYKSELARRTNQNGK